MLNAGGGINERERKNPLEFLEEKVRWFVGECHNAETEVDCPCLGLESWSPEAQNWFEEEKQEILAQAKELKMGKKELRALLDQAVKSSLYSFAISPTELFFEEEN